MIWSVIMTEKEEGKEELWSRVIDRPLLPHAVLFLIRPNTLQICWSLGVTVRLVMLCRHEILMVEEAKEWGGEETGCDPPSKEGEEASEKQGAEDSPQASQGHRQLGYWCPRSCFYHWSWCRGCCWYCLHYRIRVHFMGARQVFFRIDPPGVSTCSSESE